MFYTFLKEINLVFNNSMMDYQYFFSLFVFFKNVALHIIKINIDSHILKGYKRIIQRGIIKN